MPDLLSLQEIKRITQREGLGYCVSDFISAKVIEDQELSTLWGNAEKAVSKLKKYLELV